MGQKPLAQVLGRLPLRDDPNLLTGVEYHEDAAVYQLDGRQALVQSVDFFTPIVDDPSLFGQIAAANALSDIYAVGGRPLTALNIACFPTRKLGTEILSQILLGGSRKLAEAGCTLVGGHTIEDEEPKYGLAVTGLVDPQRFVSNAGARPGDRLVLTKPLGTGIITTAHKAGKVDSTTLKAAVSWMTALNGSASRIMMELGVSACTDITGFGLLGHADQMARSSNVTLLIDSTQVPLLSGAESLVKKGFYPGGSRSNQEAVEGSVFYEPGIPAWLYQVLCDAQTSGGLLISVAAGWAGELLKRLKDAGWTRAAIIGEVKSIGTYPLMLK